MSVDANLNALSCKSVGTPSENLPWAILTRPETEERFGKQSLSATLGRKNVPKVSTAIQEAVEAVRQQVAGVKSSKPLQTSK